MHDPRQRFQKSSCQLLCDAKDTRHTCRSNTQGPSKSLFVAKRGGLPPWPCQRRASERCMRTDCRGLNLFVSVRSRRDNMPTDGRDVPSVRISLQPLIIVCIPRTLSPYILPLFAHILSPLSVSFAISGHLSTVTALLNSAPASVVCAFPDLCLHISSRCLHAHILSVTAH